MRQNRVLQNQPQRRRSFRFRHGCGHQRQSLEYWRLNTPDFDEFAESLAIEQH